MRKVTIILMLSAVLMLVAGPAMAVDDIFIGTVAGGVVSPQPPWVQLENGWSAQWFPNEYNIQPGWHKEMWAGVTISEGAGYASFAMNWSARHYSNQEIAPTNMGDIVLVPFFDGEVSDGLWIDSGEILEIGYCPAWVSIDVMDPSGGLSEFTFDGILQHNCVPEPATMSLLVLGGIGALIRRRRRK